MQINQFFNDLPIRVLGTNEEPFFYASDVGDVLGIVNVHMSIKSFDDDDIVTPAVRAQHGLITYQKYGNTTRQNSHVVLLTELGVYRLITRSNSPIATEFRRFVFGLVKQMRIDACAQLKNQYDLDVKERDDAHMQLKIRHELDLKARDEFIAELSRPVEYVYFIRAAGSSPDPKRSDYVKIGRSQHPYDRVDQLQTACPLQLEVIATIACDAVRFERELHKLHVGRRIIGEWFGFTNDELMTAIRDAWTLVREDC